MREPAVWILVPARGGSKGIPRKNLRLLGGKPLLRHVLDELAHVVPPSRIVLSTDDAEIAGVARGRADVHERSARGADDGATLDDVAVEVCEWLRDRGASDDDLLLTVQPTSPFVSRATLMRGIAMLREGAGSVLAVRDDRHLRWTRDADGRFRPLFERRLNRQWLPPVYAETGALLGTRIGALRRSGTRLNEPVQPLEVEGRETIDIDTFADWMVAEYYARRQRVVIRADGAPLLGMGHVNRALALAHELGEHDVTIVTRGDEPFSMGAALLASHPYRVERIGDEAEFFALVDREVPSLAILDVLDTARTYVAALKQRGLFVVSFEDLGPGSALADIVVNDLYTDSRPLANHWYGVENAILAPGFESSPPRDELPPEVETVLVTFGGTDPENLTRKALEALKHVGFAGRVVAVLGQGYGRAPVSLADFGLRGDVLTSVRNMAQVMGRADLALTSGGRTVTELMTVGVPTVVMCQNMRELRHTHASGPFGVINLGLGACVDSASLASHLAMIMHDQALRASMRERALAAVRGRSNRAIVSRIMAAAAAHRSSTDAGCHAHD